MVQSIICGDDIRYLAQQPQSELTLIVGQMTSLLESISDLKRSTDSRVERLQNQGWFKRMWNTITGKNRATKEEIRRNQDKIVGYISESVAQLYKMNLIELQVMQSLGNRINQVYAQLTEVYNEQLQMKAQITEIQEIQQQTIRSLGEIANTLDEKIESIDNFHLLIKEIEQGKYPSTNQLFSICCIFAQLDKRTVSDSRKMQILKDELQQAEIVNNNQISIQDCIMGILAMSEDDIGKIYLELCNYTENFPANLFVEAIEEYHFLSKLEKMSKKKSSIIENILDKYDIDGTTEFTYSDIFETFLDNKANSFISLNQLSLSLTSTNDTNDLIGNTDKSEKNNDIATDSQSPLQKALTDSSAPLDEAEQLYWKGIYNEFRPSMFNKYVSVAKKRFEKATEKGHMASFFHIKYYTKSSDYEKERWLKEEAEKGDLEAQYMLGKFYRKKLCGDGYLRDYNKYNNEESAKPWLEKAASNGHIPAQYELGCWYDQKLSRTFVDSFLGGYSKYTTEPDYPNALIWIRKAADAGFPPAQMKLGFYYADGKGVEKDLKESFNWYYKAAMQGYEEAQYQIGKCYHEGKGVEQDLNKAIEWYKKSKNYYKSKGALEKLGIKV